MGTYDALNSLIIHNNWDTDLNLKILLICDYIHILFIQNKTWWSNSKPLWIRWKCKYFERTRSHNVDKEILSIYKSRMFRIPAQNRPHYTKDERFHILTLRHLYGWSYKTTADKFQVSPSTIKMWEKEITKNPDSPWVSLKEPINKFSDLVNKMLELLIISFPAIGYEKMANILTRAGLPMSHMKIKRTNDAMINPPDEDTSKSGYENRITEDENKTASSKGVIANYPDHVWHLDITLIPLISGFLSWIFMNILHTKYPFAWHLVSLVDQYTRRCIHFKFFKINPSAANITSFLKEAFDLCGSKPKYIISDKGSQFMSKKYKKFCKKKKNKITPRYGAVGNFHSIAYIERFFKTLKDELLPYIICTHNIHEMTLEVRDFVDWYNEYRPHSNLNALSPNDMYKKYLNKYIPPPPIDGRKSSNKIIELDISYYNNKKHLPIINLKQAA